MKLKIICSCVALKTQPSEIYLVKKKGEKIIGNFYIVKQLYFENEKGLVLELFFVFAEECIPLLDILLYN